MKISTIEEAIDDIKKGKIVIVVDDENRENEGDFVMAAEHCTPEKINFMITNGRGLLCVPMKEERMNRLGIHPMTSTNTDPHNTAFGVSVDGVKTTTGISAFERHETIMTLVKPDADAGMLRRPGHIFPLQAREKGVLERMGHTEAAVDLALIAGLEPVGVICEILNKDGTMARLPQLEKIADNFGLKIITIDDLVMYRRSKEVFVKREASFDSPTKHGHFNGVSYVDTTTGEHHVVLIKGDIKNDPSTIVRIHSECLTGDALGSIRCDCGEQLETSLRIIGESDAGVLIYLRQEGRGIGLHNKLKAYELQDNGKDTFEANVCLGFKPDPREYYVAAQIIKDIGINNVKLLTNNPLKVEGLRKYGVKNVERLPIEVEPRLENIQYLKTKKEKFGHIIHLEKLQGGYI